MLGWVCNASESHVSTLRVKPTSDRHRRPTTAVANARNPAAKHGKKYGYSSKNASPKTSGYFLAGLAKEPPRIGLGTGDRIVSRDLKEM